MKDEEMLVSGSEETREASHIFRIPSEWVNTPHLRIRYNRARKILRGFFWRKNHPERKNNSRSDAANPAWTELPLNSKLMLNGIVGINIFKA
jgi:hypothetical protein